MSVDKAMAKGTFSVLEAVKKRAYPTADVTVHTDAEAAHAIVLLLAEREAGNVTAERDNEIEEEIRSQHETLKKSALTFHMRGISEGASDAIAAESKEIFSGDDEESKRTLHSNLSHLAAHLIRVSDAEDNVDEHLFTYEDVKELQDLLPPEEFERLYNKMYELTFEARYFDRAVSADFLSKP